MNKLEIASAIRSIGLALHACNGCVTTDNVSAHEVDDYSWTIDNNKEIELLDQLEKFLNSQFSSEVA